ncbi:hypothetical protein [Pseudonocardia adelaidensis]|uniref:DUF2786 domain-containing protein n=1 Tax=Pseudonocardia adelaidensis TaxID=648754 RepID=A0ABP9NV57_9PSEU
MRPDPAALHGAAFAEGRRLRQRAERRRARHAARMEAHLTRMEMHRARHIRRMARRRAHARPPLAVALVILLVTTAVAGSAAAAIGAIIAMTIAVAAIAGPALIVGGTAVALTRRGRRRRAVAAGTAPLPARPAAPPRLEAVWTKARERFTALRAEYAAFECDPMEVLRRPALADVSVASTARFVDAFAEAQALETDSFPPAEHATSFVSAVDRAERAWRAAAEAAERIRLSGLSPAERGTVERVIKLLTTARDSDSDPERLAAYARARSELAKLDRSGVIHLPRTAQAALDEAARGELPA